MSRSIVVIVIMGISLLSPGCTMHMQLVATNDCSHPTPEKVRRVTYFWGLGQNVNIPVPDRCHSICKVETKTNAFDIIVSFITLGIIVPQNLEYCCCPFEPAPVEE